MVEAIVVRQPRPGRPGCGLRHRYSGTAVPAGRLAVVWNSFRPPVDVDEAFAEVWHRVFGSPFSLAALADPEAYSAMCTKAADGMRQAGAFGDPEEWRFDWDRPTPTTSGWRWFLPSAASASTRRPSSRSCLRVSAAPSARRGAASPVATTRPWLP